MLQRALPDPNCEINTVLLWLATNDFYYADYYPGSCSENRANRPTTIKYMGQTLEFNICHKHSILLKNIVIKRVIVSGTTVCEDGRQIWPTPTKRQKWRDEVLCRFSLLNKLYLRYFHNHNVGITRSVQVK